MTNPEIIIIDDDPMVGQLSKDLLVDDGYNVLLLDESRTAFQKIKEVMPQLVISDIMMPGITGLDICKLIKTDPKTKNIKVIIVSGKSYEVEKQRAFQLGADLFLQKPYNVETFSKTVNSIMKGTPSEIIKPESPKINKIEEPIQNNPIKENEIHLTLNGIRGLSNIIPTSTSKYGRQTPCVSFETNKDIFIFDAGTGIVNLGLDIVKNKRYYKNIWLFLSHYHLDNIIGLPNFEPLHDSAFSINIAGPNDPEKSLKEIIKSNFYSSFSPIKSAPKSKVELYQVFEDKYEISKDFKVITMYANHPTSTMIYFIEINGLKIAYAPDSEIWGNATALQDYDERLGKFSKGSDIFIHDTYYNDKDYERFSKRGHSSISITTEFAINNEIKNYIPFNLNPDYSDDILDNMIKSGQDLINTNSSNLKIILPEENKKIILKGISKNI